MYPDPQSYVLEPQVLIFPIIPTELSPHTLSISEYIAVIVYSQEVQEVLSIAFIYSINSTNTRWVLYKLFSCLGVRFRNWVKVWRNLGKVYKYSLQSINIL